MSGEEKVIKVVVEKKGKEKDETAEEEIKRLKQELEDRDEKLGILGDEKKQLLEKEFERKKKQLGCTDASIKSPEQLMAWASGAGKEIKSGGSGVLTLVIDPNTGRQVQRGGQTSFLQKKYDKSPEGFRAMVDDLHEKAKSKDPEEAAESQAILDELLLKAVRDAKEGKKTSGDVPMKLDMKKYNKEKAEKKNE